MTWQSFFSGAANVARITGLIILKILMFIVNLIFMATKFVFFLLVTILTLGRAGMSTVDFGGRRR